MERIVRVNYNAMIRISSRHSRALAWLEHMITMAIICSISYAVLVYVFNMPSDITVTGQAMFYIGSLQGFGRGRK